MEGAVYFTDGPSLWRSSDGTLYLLWSSWSDHGYAVGGAVSESGTLAEPWRQNAVPLFPADSRRGMLFECFDRTLFHTLHYSNTKCEEHPMFALVAIENKSLKLKEESHEIIEKKARPQFQSTVYAMPQTAAQSELLLTAFSGETVPVRERLTIPESEALG